MGSNKKSDLKAELTDLLMGDEDSEQSISGVLDLEPVTIGSPDQTALLNLKREKAKEEQRKRETQKSSSRTQPERASAIPSAKISLTPAMAQSRIDQLESEIDSLRSENQKDEATVSALRAQTEEMSKRLIEWEKRYKEMIERKDLDLQLSREELGHKNTKFQETTKQLEELESRFEGEFHRIRVRERELQNRLDILKHEGGAVVRHKDDLILELKKQLEKISYENENSRKKNQGAFNQVEAQQERIKRAMKALRVAVSLLDGEEDKSFKKAE